MATVQAVLKKCDAACLDLFGDAEKNDCVQSSRMIMYLMDSRRIQKVLWRQLSVLDSMMTLVEGLESAEHLLTQPCPVDPENQARARWKALKVETLAGVKETEALIGSLQDRVAQIDSRRQRLTQLVRELENKKKKSEQLERSLEKAQNALHVSEGQLKQLRAESEAVLNCLGNWQLLRDELHGFVLATQKVTQTKLLSVGQSELCLEQKPHLCENQASNELEPLKLSVTWSQDDCFRLKVHQGKAGMVDECMKGRLSEFSTALLEIMQRYTSQGDMLAEIQGLHSSFAIDWRPAQRLLVYLKSASVVCSLEVEEGYPSAGRAKLLSVRRDTHPVDTAKLQPLKDNPSLTEWLVFLCSSPLV